MTTKERIRLQEAEEVASEILTLLAPVCERVEVAGSIRRQRPWVSDVEIVAIPRPTVQSTDLFGAAVASCDELSKLCGELKASGVLTDRPDRNGRPAWGPKFKRAVYSDTPLDLFSATPENWGVIQMLRTGPAEFNLKLVKQKAFGGYMPFGMVLKDGYLWMRGERLVTASEEDVFEALGLPYTKATERG